jgi:hypothetical protein
LSADRKMSKFEEYLYKLDEVLQDTGPTTNWSADYADYRRLLKPYYYPPITQILAD